MKCYDIPLVVRGKVITDNFVTFTARREEIEFRTPDVNKHLNDIILRNPHHLLDVQQLLTSEIIDYLVRLGERLHPDGNDHMRLARDICLNSSGLAPETVGFIFDNMGRVLTRSVLDEIVANNIGPAVLDGWQTILRGEREVSVRAFGARAVHITAGNSASLAVHGTMTNALLRSDAIFKLPSNDPFTATAVALTMIDMDPDHPVTRHMSVAYWRGGDEAFEAALFRPTNVEKIVAWGGFASMKHIRSHLAPGMDLIALDPKISASIIGKEVFESEAKMQLVAERLAMDVGGFNQEACVNSRLTYVEVGDGLEHIAKLNQLGKMVYDAIQALPAEVSGPHPAFDPILREELQDLKFNDQFQVIGNDLALGAVVVSQENEAVEFAERLGCRVANLIPVSSVEEAVSQITIHTQTIGVYPDRLKYQIRDICAVHGAQRLTSLGGALGESMAQPHDAIEQFRRMVRWVVDETVDRPSQAIRVFA